MNLTEREKQAFTIGYYFMLGSYLVDEEGYPQERVKSIIDKIYHEACEILHMNSDDPIKVANEIFDYGLPEMLLDHTELDSLR
jgi:hypothetical protein